MHCKGKRTTWFFRLWRQGSRLRDQLNQLRTQSCSVPRHYLIIILLCLRYLNDVITRMMFCCELANGLKIYFHVIVTNFRFICWTNWLYFPRVVSSCKSDYLLLNWFCLNTWHRMRQKSLSGNEQLNSLSPMLWSLITNSWSSSSIVYDHGLVDEDDWRLRELVDM